MKKLRIAMMLSVLADGDGRLDNVCYSEEKNFSERRSLLWDYTG
jgi:hypothetical protein